MFVAITVVVAMCAKLFIPGVSLFFAWDLAAIVSMIVYFIYYWVRTFALDGPLKSGGSDVRAVGIALALLLLGLLFLGGAFYAGVKFSQGETSMMPVQLLVLIAASVLIYLSDRQIMKRHSDRRIQLEFKLFVEFVDIPMAFCFGVLTVFYFVLVDKNSLQQFAAFMSGAIAFQIVAFNVAFAFLSRFTVFISRGSTAVLLNHEGKFAKDYPQFKNSWWQYWSRPLGDPEKPKSA